MRDATRGGKASVARYDGGVTIDPPARILVIGSPGAGKSTFARALAARTGLPLVHLDREYWQPGWVEPDKAAWRAAVAAMVAAPRWIIDGCYTGTLPLRLTAAELVIFLDLPPWLCVGRIVRRVIASRGAVRADMAGDCPERLSLGFLWYVVRFRTGTRPRIEAALRDFGGRTVRVHRPRDVAALLDRGP